MRWECSCGAVIEATEGAMPEHLLYPIQVYHREQGHEERVSRSAVQPVSAAPPRTAGARR